MQRDGILWASLGEHLVIRQADVPFLLLELTLVDHHSENEGLQGPKSCQNDRISPLTASVVVY